MSFDDFLNHPRYEIESMIKVIDEVTKQKNKANESMLKNLENAKIPKDLDID